MTQYRNPIFADNPAEAVAVWRSLTSENDRLMEHAKTVIEDGGHLSSLAYTPLAVPCLACAAQHGECPDVWCKWRKKVGALARVRLGQLMLTLRRRSHGEFDIILRRRRHRNEWVTIEVLAPLWDDLRWIAQRCQKPVYPSPKLMRWTGCRPQVTSFVCTEDTGDLGSGSAGGLDTEERRGFDALYGALYSATCQAARYAGLPAGEAEEIAQSLWLWVWERWPERLPFSSDSERDAERYLRRAALNRARSRLRRPASVELGDNLVVQEKLDRSTLWDLEALVETEAPLREILGCMTEGRPVPGSLRTWLWRRREDLADRLR